MVKRIIKDEKIPRLEKSVACIGYFDGVHLGHQELIKKTIDEAIKLNVLSTLICFEPDPVEVITGNKKLHLLSYKNRLNLIEYFGIDQIIVIKFSNDLMKITPKNFIEKYLNRLNIIELVCGYDYTFGYKGMGTVETLSKNNKFKTIVIPEYKYRRKKVSSTRIINEYKNGNFKLVDRLLGYEYASELKVIKCSKENNKYILECKSYDSKCVIPNDAKYGNGFEVRNNKVYITGTDKLKVNQKLLISFSNYE